MDNGEERIPTNMRTLLILEAIGQSSRAMTPTEINQHLNLPKQTVHRLCTTLEEEGFLMRDTNGKRLRPSPRLKELASGLLNNSIDQIVRRQILVDISASVKETINFVVPEDDGMMYLDRVETDWPFRIQLPVGSHVPFHCTASGKTFLANMPLSQRRIFVKGIHLKRMTENTFDDEEKLLEELAQISKQGYAVDDEEFMDGMIAVAVPVKDKKGRYYASLACHAPTQRISLSGVLSYKKDLIEGAALLGKELFS